ncbi:MAG: guanylate kinase [Rhodoglobus sp.]
MSPRPEPPEVDRAAASRAAIVARRARAEIKRHIADRTRSALDAAQAGWDAPGSAEASLRVTELLGSIPSLGPTRTGRVMHELEISDKKRVGGLGVRQRQKLHDFLLSREAPATRRLVVLAGPTAVGKGTVSAHIRDNHPGVQLSVSATTRPPRPGEVDGVHYFFVSDEEFDRMIADGELLEWAIVHNSYRYGTPRPPIDAALAAGKRVLLEIDLQGARSVRTVMPEARLIFLLPPSWEELVRRLTGRDTENVEEQQRRLETAKVELAAQDEFDARVVNSEVGQAAAEVVELMDALFRATPSR